MSWSQLRSADMPNCRSILDDLTAVGLMPVASPSDSDANRTWVSLGAGRSAAGGEITGDALPGGGFQVNVDPVRAANERAHTGAVPGLLGSQLHARGLTTALIAYQASVGAGFVNPARTEATRLPPSAAIIMDESGRIDGGGIHMPAKITPLGKWLDPEQVRSAVDQARSQHDVVVLDLTGVASPGNADNVIRRVTHYGHTSDRYYLLTGLAPGYSEEDKRTMGFVICFGFLLQGGRSVNTDIPSLLTSRSTRWVGVVTPQDLAATMLAREADEQGDREDAASRQSGPQWHRAMAGRPMQEAYRNKPPRDLDRLDRMLTDQFILEGKAARLYVVYMMALAAATSIFGGWRRGLKWLAMPALIGVALPIGLLLCPLAGIGQTRQLVAACVVSVALGAFAFWPGPADRRLGIVLLIGAGTMLADPILGSPLMRFAPLGFGAVTGARFYGIGNEYVGVLGAMAPIGLGLMLQEIPPARRLAAPIGAFVVLVVGAPWWGANWGGCVSIAAGLLAVWVALARQRRWLRALVALCGVLVAAALPAALDLLQPESARSHIGAAASALIAGQLDTIRDTAVRKLEMNWQLARLASWWWLLAPVAALGIWALVRRGKSIWHDVSSADPMICGATPSPMRAGFIGAVVTALVGLLVNDSGIVILGMTMAVTFGAFAFLLARAELAAP